MGRHADPDPWPFWRSLGSATLRSLIALTVVAGLFVALGAVGQPFARLPVAVDDPPRAGNVRGDGPVVESPDGIVVRVLDAAGDPERADHAARTLSELGYDVVGIISAEKVSPKTTVLFTSEAAKAARTLARGDERFSRIDRSPGLPGGADLYVVVGEDWPDSGVPPTGR